MQDISDILPAHKVGHTPSLAAQLHAISSKKPVMLHCLQLPVCSPLQYDVRPLLALASEQLAKELPASWSLDPSSPTYILK
jgi:hypothetical protein